MPGAMVHHGFYFAHHNMTIQLGILDAIIRAKDLYGDINVMVTGHSMGGAMASFCRFGLVVNHEARNVQVLTFGQPCVGSAVFASYYSDCVPNTIRISMDVILSLICLRTIVSFNGRLIITSPESYGLDLDGISHKLWGIVAD